jgi:hypothetical protein
MVMPLSGKSPVQRFAAGFGIVYAVLGVAGALATQGCPLLGACDKGIFGVQLNMWHNVLHFGVGSGLLLAAFLPSEVTKGVLLGLGSFFVVATSVGLTGALHEYASIPGGLGSLDNLFHAASTAAAFLGATLGAVRKPIVANGLATKRRIENRG